MIKITAIYKGEEVTKTVRDWSKISGISPKAIWSRRKDKLKYRPHLTWGQVVGIELLPSEKGEVDYNRKRIYAEDMTVSWRMSEISRMRLSNVEITRNCLMSGWSI